MHNLLTRDKWQNLQDEDFNLLLPSLRLASKLITVGTAYFAEFLVNARLHADLTQKYQSVPRQDHVINFRRVPFTDDDLDKTRNALNEIAQDIKWTLNRTLGVSGALGMTRHLRDGPYAEEPWGPMDVDAVIESDREWRQQGKSRRPLLVGIMFEYLIALRAYAPGTENHFRALFHAAVTIAHEVGHVVWCQDFRSDASFGDMGAEPWVENYAQAELGFSFEAFLFSGFHVRTANVIPDKPLDFECAAVWNPLLTTDLTRRNDRLLYRTQYAIAVEYMQLLLSQDFWNSLGSPTDRTFSARAVAALRPRTDLAVDPTIATATVRNWTLRLNDGEVVWLREFVDRGFTPSLQHKVPRSEIELVRDELRPFFKKSLAPTKNPFGEDDDEDFDFAEEDFGIEPDAQLTEAEIQRIMERKEPYIDDGVVTFDYRPTSSDEEAGLSTTLTVVEVRYVPPGTVKSTSAKRARSPDSDEDEYATAKRQKLNFLNKKGVAYSIEEMLERVSPPVFEQWTNEEAVEYAIKENFEPGPQSLDEAVLRSRLSMDNLDDQYLIERIRCYHFRLLEAQFAHDNRALVMIKKARIESFSRWSKSDIVDLLRIQGMVVSGTEAEITARAGSWLKFDMEDLVELLPENDKEVNFAVKDYDSWTDAQFRDFFRRNNLPEWGELSIRKLRVQRFRDQVSRNRRPDRTSILINKDGLPHPRVGLDGVEIYRFDVVLDRSTVAGLKSDLFRIAMIPANHDINLFFGQDRTEPLQDVERLDFYDEASVDWTTLEMTTVLREGAPPVPKLLVPGYIPVITGSAGSPGDGDTLGVPAGPGGQRNDDGNKPSSPIDPVRRRDYDIRKGTVQPTVTERLQTISRQSLQLKHILVAGGGVDPLRPHLKDVLASTSIEMLNNIDNILDVNKENNELVDRYVDDFGQSKPPSDVFGVDLENDIPNNAPEHMRDLFRRLRSNQGS